MNSHPHRAERPTGIIHERQLDKPAGIPDIETEPLRYIALALIHLRDQIAEQAKLLQDQGRPVDEYRPQTLAGDSETAITLQPQWESIERIEQILITGPAGQVTLQLGDRVWSLTIPATGFILIAPVAIFLGRDDVRQLTAQAAGDYTLELMGFADTRAGLL
jgi:hypothetical protein